MAKKKNSKELKKIEKIESESTNYTYKILQILFIVVVFLAVFYMITVMIVGRDDKEKQIKTQIQYDEILAGSSFDMRDENYYVVYYDFSNAENSSIYSAILDFNNKGSKRLYSVDMNNGFNKKFVGSKSNKNPKSINDLVISDVTLIEIKDGKVIKYYEGSEKVISKLK